MTGWFPGPMAGFDLEAIDGSWPIKVWTGEAA
jgi:hypothetical protein